MALCNRFDRSKFQPKGTKLTFVGYADLTKGYRLYNKSNKSIVIARDVIFLRTNAVKAMYHRIIPTILILLISKRA